MESVQWTYVDGGLAPTTPIKVDCKATDPGGLRGACYQKPAWVIEDFNGYHPTCRNHIGEVTLSMLGEFSEDDSGLTAVFHRYKGE